MFTNNVQFSGELKANTNGMVSKMTKLHFDEPKKINIFPARL